MTNFESLLEEAGRMKCVVTFLLLRRERVEVWIFVGTLDRCNCNRLQKEAATNNSNYHRRAVQVQAWLSKSIPAYAVRDEYDKLSTSFEQESAQELDPATESTLCVEG
jgi:hypothetical protein